MSNKFSNTAYLFVMIIILFSNHLRAQNDSNFRMKPIGSEAFKVMSDFLNYDQGIPLNPRVVESTSETDHIFEKIVFRGTHDDRVPGFLAIPKNGTGPYPCVLLVHGFNGSKESWWDDSSFESGGLLTKELIKSGYAVLALDAQYHGERMANNDFESPGVFGFKEKWRSRLRDYHGQTIKDYRRAIVYLASRSEIDSSRIGMIGYSIGGLMTFNLSAIDARIKVSVAAVTPLMESQYSLLKPVNFAPYITKQPLLMLMAEKDNNYTIKEAQQLHDLVSSDAKEIVFYESGHGLPSEWIKEAVKWMEKYL